MGLRRAGGSEVRGVYVDFSPEHMGPERLGFGPAELRFDIEGQERMEKVVG